MNPNSQIELQELIALIDGLVQRRVMSTTPDFKVWHTSVKRLLSREFGPSSVELRSFEDISFSLHVVNRGVTLDNLVMACREGLDQAKALLSSYVRDDRVSAAINHGEEEPMSLGRRIFLVHGHDGELRESVARLLEKQGFEPIILMEQANAGATIIEKFERFSDVGAAVCLFTGDDLVENDGDGIARKRARQNVIFEAGYFIGRLGRERVAIISESDIDIPSDLAGVLYVNKSDWMIDLLKELRTMGFEIDFNRVF